MSDFISAIKRFIEDWVEGKPRLVHYESVEDVVDEQADELHVEFKQVDIAVLQNEINQVQNEHIELSQLCEPEVLIEVPSPKEQLGQPPYGEGEGPGQWVMGLGNWQWLPDKPTEPPKGETFKTGKWVRDSTTENWSWISLRPETTKTAISKDGRSTIEATPTPRSRTRPLAQPTKSNEQVLADAERLIKEVEQLIKELER